MGRLADGLRSFWRPEVPLRDPVLVQYFGGGATTSGAAVTEWTALNFASWWGAVQIISNAVAALPLFLYRRLPDGGKERFTGHPLYRILHDEFNGEMTSVKARQTMQAHVLTWGNAYAEIIRNEANQVAQLRPITPDRVTPDLNERGDLIYRVHQPKSGRDRIFSADTILHIPGLGFDGLVGYSVVRKARETIGLGMTAEAYGAQFFGNGAVSSLVATHPKTLQEPARKNLKQSITEAIGGGKKHSVLVLEEGMTVEKTSIPPDDAQFLLTRRFQAVEICKWFNLPPHKLAELDRATFSNIEHQSIEFVTDCLRPWLVTWEQELNRKLVRPLERTIQFTEHLVDGLLRGDLPSRYAAYAVGRQWGWLSADDVRERENMNPLPDGTGQQYLVPMNMTPADRVDDLIDAQTRPPAPPAAPAREPAPEPDPERVQKIVADLRQELQSNLAQVAAHLDASVTEWQRDGVAGREQILARIGALPAPPDPAPVLKAVEATAARLEGLVDEVRATQDQVDRIKIDVVAELEALPKPDPDLAATLASEVAQVEARLAEAADARVAELRERHDAMVGAVAAAALDVKTHLATAQQLRAWQENTIAMIAGTLARRELAFVKRLAKDPTHAADRLAVHYARVVDDGVRDLARFDVGPAVRDRLTRWAADATAECLLALGDETLAELPVRWVERHRDLTQALLAAALGGVEPPPSVAPAPEREDEEPAAPGVALIIEKEVLSRDPSGRPQKLRETTTDEAATLIVEKEVIDRDPAGRPNKIRETHTRKP
jgi:HK97 family phage portal protein